MPTNVHSGVAPPDYGPDKPALNDASLTDLKTGRRCPCRIPHHGLPKRKMPSAIWTKGIRFGRTGTAAISVGRRQNRLDASRPGIRGLLPDAVLEVFIQRPRRPPHAHMRQASVKSAGPVIKPPTQRAHDPDPPRPFLMPPGSPERGSAMLQNSRCPPDAGHAEKPKKVTTCDTADLACSCQTCLGADSFTENPQYFFITRHSTYFENRQRDVLCPAPVMSNIYAKNKTAINSVA